MKLFKSQKKSEGPKPSQQLHQKVKTFSKAYDYSPAGSVKNVSASSFLPDERPYPVAPLPVPETVKTAEPEDINDPERIDLQDTILTDDSFVERIPKPRPAAAVPPVTDVSVSAPDANDPVSGPEEESYTERTDSPEETEEYTDNGDTATPEPFVFPEDDPGTDDVTESFFVSGTDTGYDAEPEYGSGYEGLYGDEQHASPDAHSDENEATDAEPLFVPDEESEDDAVFLPGSVGETESASADSAGEETSQETEPESGTVHAVRLLPKLETKGKTSLVSSWQPVADADGYDLLLARSGEPFDGVYRTLSPEETAFTFKDLEKKTVYKVRVRAFELAYGQKTVICESDTVRCITGGSTKKYTNAQKVKTKDTGLELSVGEKKKISASAVGEEEGRRILPSHGSELRYLSEDTSVAAVSDEGKVRGIAPGSCRVYVIAANGIHSVLDVTVLDSTPAVAFRKKKYSLTVGKSINLKKKLKEKPDLEAGSLKWKSSDRDIAEVSKKGIVTALKKGSITVRVKTSDSGSAKVRIRIVPSKKTDPFSWDGFDSGKKNSSGKKWSYFA